MIRALFKADLNDVLAIEKSVHISPWTADTFKICFEPGYLGWVLELNHKIIGFIILSLRFEDCHILNLCVTQEHQHKGYGRQMMEYALKDAKKHGAKIAYLEVRRSNDYAISLYQKMNFYPIGERKAYYPALTGTNEDALIFAKNLLEDQFTE